MRVRSCSAPLIAVVVLFSALPASAWWQEQHRWQTSQALDYMENSGDPFLEYIQEWLWWAPGYNSLLYGFDTEIWLDSRCMPGAEAYPGYYSAACALRDEAANTDWMADMYLTTSEFNALAVCAECAVFPPYDFEGLLRCTAACMIPLVADIKDLVEAILFVANIFIEDVTLPAWLQDEIPRIDINGVIDDLNMTSMNHFLGVAHGSDLVSRQTAGNEQYDPDCASREADEHLGFVFKNPLNLANLNPWICDEGTDGDCPGENFQAFLLSFLGYEIPDLISIVPSDAANNYEHITCHDHGVRPYQNHSVCGQRWLPVDNIAEFWMDNWMGGHGANVVALGIALHAVQDSTNPHHNQNYIQKGHRKFEDWTVAESVNSGRCMRGWGMDCLEYASEFYDRGFVEIYLEREEFDDEELPESYAADNAERFVEEYPDYERPIVWQAEDRSKNYLERDDGGAYRTIGAMGNNMAVAATVATLRREFDRHQESWNQSGYCADLRRVDMDRWLRIMPGPRAGVALHAH